MTGEPLVVAKSQSLPSEMVSDDNAVYWINAGDADGAVMKLAK